MTHSPLKEKTMKKHTYTLSRITKQLAQGLAYKKTVQALFSDLYFISEQKIIFYKCPL